MDLSIDLRSPIPVYRQIIAGIRRVLVTGAIAPGETLPTVRELAFELGVHHNTVAQAYRALADEGWLDLRRRRGATVLDRARPAAEAGTETTYLRRLQELVAEAASAGVPRRRIAIALGKLAHELEEHP